MSLSCAAVNFGLDERLLDHIAPLCALLDIPLYVTDEKNRDLLQRYYPFVKVIFHDPVDLKACMFASYDLLFQSTFWRTEEKTFFSIGRKKKLFFAYLPHGNSDKGYHAPMMDLIGDQDFVLIYGNQMVERLKKQGFWQDVKRWALIGNYREAFYREHQDFYDSIIGEEICSSLDPKKKICLYAPTWQDPEHSSSFFSETQRLVEELPETIQLLIKPHPLLEENDPARYQQMMGLCEGKKNIQVIERMPLIYPLLARCDLYVGDFSSIGYDYLIFQRPMFFLPAEKSRKEESLFLRQCGIEIPRQERIFSFIETNLRLCESLKEKQQRLEEFSFGEKRSLSQIKENLSLELKRF